jgi:hypothetical protein
MTKEMNCSSCGAPATLTKVVSLCARCGLAVAEEALGFVFGGLRDGATVIELPAPKSVMSPKDANDVMYQRLVSLRRKGAKRVTFQDFRDLMGVTERSRQWVYKWLDERVGDGDLVKEKTADGTSYTLAY